MTQKQAFKETEIGKTPENWKESKIGDCIELIYGKSLPERQRKKGNIPVFGSNGIVGFHNEASVKSPGIIIGRKGSVGEITFSKQNFWPIDTTYYVQTKQGNDIGFWYYFLKTLGLNQMNTHSAVPGLNRDNVYEIVRAVPNFTEQLAIASILGSLDDKIALNRSMNSTLEAIGQALFKHWFVDFEFPDGEGKPYRSSGGEMVETELGEVPRGWKAKPIDQVAVFLNGLAMQKYPPKGEDYLPVIKIRELKQGTTESSDKASPEIDKKFIVNDGDILFSWSGSLEVCIWCGGRGALNQHLFKVTSQNYPKWFYYQWIKVYLPEFQHIAEGKATTMGHIQRHHLSNSFVAVPPNEIIEKANKILNPLIERYINNDVESNNLSKIRDALLPKLMSGEVRVNI